MNKHKQSSIQFFKVCCIFSKFFSYEGKFYYGGWDIKDSGEGEKNGWGY